MATMAAEAAFVDTNLLVHASRERSPSYPRAIAVLQQARTRGDQPWFSRQIVREYLAVVTRPQPSEPALSNAEANAGAKRFLAALNIAEDGPQVTGTLLQLLSRYPPGGKQIHDANIVATMLAHGIIPVATIADSDVIRGVAEV